MRHAACVGAVNAFFASAQPRLTSRIAMSWHNTVGYVATQRHNIEMSVIAALIHMLPLRWLAAGYTLRHCFALSIRPDIRLRYIRHR